MEISVIPFPLTMLGEADDGFTYTTDTARRLVAIESSPCDDCPMAAKCQAEQMACGEYAAWASEPTRKSNMPRALELIRKSRVPSGELFRRIFADEKVPLKLAQSLAAPA